MDAIAESQPDEIYNLASQSYVPTSWTQPALTAEYTPDESPQTERTAFRPRNPYGVAKAYAHWMTVNYREQYKLFRKITHGAAMIKLGLADELKLGNLDARRDWCYARDAIHFNCVGLNWQDYVSVDPAFYRPDEPHPAKMRGWGIPRIY